MAADEAAARRGPADEAATRRGPAPPRSRSPRHCGNDGALLPLPLRAEGLAGGRGAGRAGLMGQAGRQRRVPSPTGSRAFWWRRRNPVSPRPGQRPMSRCASLVRGEAQSVPWPVGFGSPVGPCRSERRTVITPEREREFRTMSHTRYLRS